MKPRGCRLMLLHGAGPEVSEVLTFRRRKTQIRNGSTFVSVQRYIEVSLHNNGLRGS